MNSDRPPDQAGRPLLELVLDEQSALWKQGERVAVEDLLARYPALRDDAAAVVDLIHHEYLLRRRLNEAPAPAEFIRRFPEQSAALLQRFAVDEVVGSASGNGAIEALDSAKSNEPSAALPSASPPVPSLSIEGFRIIRQIGRGGMGVVYEAEDKTLGRRVALKVLLDAAVALPKQVQRFEREARAAARLHHTNIVPVFGVGQQNGHHYYVMQYIEGRGLDAVINELRRLRETGTRPRQAAAHEPLPEPHATEPPAGANGAGQCRMTAGEMARSLATGEFAAAAQPPFEEDTKAGSDETAVLPAAHAFEYRSRKGFSPFALPGSSELSSHSTLDRPYFQSVARIGLQVAEALEYANRQGVLHRDVKPSNLLLDSNGNVWVSDFGLAKTEGADDLTSTGDLLGTLRYMAPERFHGECDARSDVYGLGLTLYELVALRAAYEAADRQQLIRRILDEEPARVGKLVSRVPRDLETIIHKAIAHEPALRYATAGALAEDLRRFTENRTILARRASTGERVVRWCRRNPWATATFVILLAAVTTSSVLAILARTSALAARTAEAATGKARDRAETEAKIATAINAFLRKDLLASASPFNQGALNSKPDPDLKLRTVLDLASKTIGARFAAQPLVEASIRQTIGETYLQLGLYPQARLQLERALELRRRELGPGHPDTFIAMNRLGALDLADAKLAEAESFLLPAMKGLLGTLGPDDPESLTAMFDVAGLYSGQEKLDEAEHLLLQVLEGRRRVRGADHPETLEVMSSLPDVYGAQAFNAANRGNNAQADEKYRKAEQLLTAALASYERRGETEHPGALAAKVNLSFVYRALGKSTEAARLLNEALSAQRAVLGDKHPDTLATMVLLAQGYRDQKKFSEAESLLREAVAGCRSALDRNHQTALAALGVLSSVYSMQRDLKQLGPVLIEARDITLFRLGPDHALTAAANRSVGLFFLAQGQHVKAEPYLRDSLRWMCTHQPGDWERYVMEDSLGRSLLGQKKYDEAKARLFSAYAGMKARETSEPPLARAGLGKTVALIARLYHEAGASRADKDFARIWSDPEFHAALLDLQFPAAPFAYPDLPADVFAQP